MQTNLEQTILRNLLTDEKYMRKVLPFIKPEYFEGIYRTLFKDFFGREVEPNTDQKLSELSDYLNKKTLEIDKDRFFLQKD